MRRVLVLAAPVTGAAFADLVEGAGGAPTVADPAVHGPDTLERGGVDVVVAVESSGDGPWPDRRWGEAVIAFVEGGGGLVCCRPAATWFAGWDRWDDLLGIRHRTGGPDGDTSGRIDVESPVRFDDRAHPVTAGLAARPPLTVVPAPFDAVAGTAVLAHCAGRAVVWTTGAGTGRIVVDSLAYDADALLLPARRTLLERAVRWVGET